MSGPRPRRDRVVLNDERILDAAVVVLDLFGIDGLSARRVAEQAGLSTGAIYGRFENTDELLVEVWNRRLRSVVLAGLERSIRMSDPAVGDPDPVVPESFDPVAERVGAFLIALAPRSDVLSEVVVPDVDASLRVMGVGPGNSAISRARRAIAIAAYFGAMLNGSVSEALHPDWVLCLRWWEEARARETLPLSGPVAWLPPARIAVESGNPELDVLLLATGEVMARAGVAGTTVTRIARRAGVPRSTVYAHFDSKDDLVQACIFQATASARRLKSLTTPHGVASVAHRVTDPAGRQWRRRRIEGLLAAVYSPALASAVLLAELETENELIMRIGLIDVGQEYALRQLLLFFDVLASGLAVVPELSTVFEGIDWRIVLTPIAEQATAEIFGELRPGLATTG
ncbi:MAG: helix-turn-helix domain-containing protein [Actinomycetota bacterium]